MKTLRLSIWLILLLSLSSFSANPSLSLITKNITEIEINSNSFLLENNSKLEHALKLLDTELQQLDRVKDVDKVNVIAVMRAYLNEHIEAEDANQTMLKAFQYSMNYFREINKNLIDTYKYIFYLYSKINKKIHGISVKRSTGTGQTTGHIATLSVENNSAIPFNLIPQFFYIPSDGKYQEYEGEIDEGISIPPFSTIEIPINGNCITHNLPPVPLGSDMPPFDTWIPVLTLPSNFNEIFADVQVPEPMNPPGASEPPAAPEPMNPPGGSSEPTVPEPMNPPGGTKPTLTPMVSEPPPSNPYVSLSNKQALEPFDPTQIPVKTADPNVKPAYDDFMPTWPGTSIIIDEIIDPKDDPNLYAQITVAAVLKIKNAVEEIQENTNLKTPWSSNPEQERETVIQQVVWRYFSMLRGTPYERDDFEENLHTQIEDATGKSFYQMTDEEQEEISVGAANVWTFYSGTGLEAKVFGTENVTIETDNPEMADFLASVETPGCECDSITYDLEVKRGREIVHTGSHTNRKSPKVEIKDLKYGDELGIKLSNIVANCKCDDEVCQFYPPESDSPNSSGYTNTDTTRPGKVSIELKNDGAGVISRKGNNNCQNEGKSWNSTGDEYSFKLKTRDEGTKEKSIFQRLTIKSYCELDDCRRKLCKKLIQLNFVKK